MTVTLTTDEGFGGKLYAFKNPRGCQVKSEISTIITSRQIQWCTDLVEKISPQNFLLNLTIANNINYMVVKQNSKLDLYYHD